VLEEEAECNFPLRAPDAPSPTSPGPGHYNPHCTVGVPITAVGGRCGSGLFGPPQGTGLQLPRGTCPLSTSCNPLPPSQGTPFWEKSTTQTRQHVSHTPQPEIYQDQFGQYSYPYQFHSDSSRWLAMSNPITVFETLVISSRPGCALKPPGLS